MITDKAGRTRLREEQMQLIEYFSAMVGCYAAMPESEKQALHEWENSVNLHILGTSRWPGWAKYIGPRPEFQHRSGPSRIPLKQSVRMKVWERDGFKCLHCGIQTNLSVDHIIPESKGGSGDLSNLQTLCRPCNSKKGCRT